MRRSGTEDAHKRKHLSSHHYTPLIINARWPKCVEEDKSGQKKLKSSPSVASDAADAGEKEGADAALSAGKEDGA